MNKQTILALQNRLVAQARHANWLALHEHDPRAQDGAREYDLGRRDAFLQAARMLRQYEAEPFAAESEA